MTERARRDTLSPFGERVGVRGLQLLFVIERSKPLTPLLSLWEREPTAFVAPP
jgi:hypothetical protein